MLTSGEYWASVSDSEVRERALILWLDLWPPDLVFAKENVATEDEAFEYGLDLAPAGSLYRTITSSLDDPRWAFEDEDDE